MKHIFWLLLALPLAACVADDSSFDMPVQTASQDGDCNALAREHESEAAYLNLDETGRQQVFAQEYKDCTDWKSAHTWAQSAP
jgi:hypothetical protein